MIQFNISSRKILKILDFLREQDYINDQNILKKSLLNDIEQNKINFDGIS